MSALTGLMTRIGAITLTAALCGFALPKGNLSESGRRAMSLMILAAIAESIVGLIGGI